MSLPASFFDRLAPHIILPRSWMRHVSCSHSGRPAARARSAVCIACTKLGREISGSDLSTKASSAVKASRTYEGSVITGHGAVSRTGTQSRWLGSECRHSISHRQLHVVECVHAALLHAVNELNTLVCSHLFIMPSHACVGRIIDSKWRPLDIEPASGSGNNQRLRGDNSMLTRNSIQTLMTEIHALQASDHQGVHATRIWQTSSRRQYIGNVFRRKDKYARPITAVLNLTGARSHNTHSV